MLAAALLAVALSERPVTADFYDYLRAPDPSFGYRIEEVQGDTTILDMTSQTWQGVPWKHKIVLIQPRSAPAKGLAILHITGGVPNPREVTEFQAFSRLTQIPVVALYGIPSQPLWGMWEDDLIAHTFEKFLETGEGDWPLLFPMTKSALRAMDAVQDTTRNGPNPVRRYLVTGASKRGWTTWFVGASRDRRVAAISPLVIDNLNIPAQMAHQIASWGQYSLQIQDYTRRGLQQKMDTHPRGKRLAQMVDPFTYRDAIRVPTLIINGGNDPYWTVDALSMYWNDLRMPKFVKIIPNVGHGLEDRYLAIETLSAFAKSVRGDFRMPRMDGKIVLDGNTLRAEIKTREPGLQWVKLWTVQSDDLDFRPHRWEAVARIDAPDSRGPAIGVRMPDGKNVAAFAEVRWKIAGNEFSLTTPATVFRKR